MLAMMVAAQIGCLASGPAYAQADDGEDYSVSCTADAATWQGSDADGTGVEVPKGTFTRIFTCPVAGHLVRMNFSSMWQPHYLCGAMEDGAISVWVDGVKVVDRREIGGYAECVGLPAAGTVVHKIIVNRLMHMTLCANPGEAKTCEITDLSLRIPKAGKNVSAAIARTPVALMMVKAGDGVCRVLDAKLQGHMLDDADPVTAAFGVYSNMDDLVDGKPRSYALDIDNDGVPDQLTEEADDNKEIDMDRLHWRRSGMGADLPIDGKAVNGLEWNGSLVDFVTLIRVDGKTYIYKRDNSVGNALPHQAPDWWEAVAGTFAQVTPTRHLLVAGTGGAFNEVCSWAPKPRPEEFE